MTSELSPRSFDRPRERRAPTSLTGRWSNGGDVVVTLTRLTLLIIIKSNCDGCRDFYTGDLDLFAGRDVLFVSGAPDIDVECTDPQRPVLVAPDVLAELDVKWPPFYVLIDPAAAVVRCEGVLFGPSQVAAEIEAFLTR